MPAAQRLDNFQRRHPRSGFPLAVVYKFTDDQGSYLAALVAYYGFVSLFPLLLLTSTLLGLVLAGDPHLQARVLGSALSQFPVIGAQLQAPRHLSGGPAGLLIGILGSLYGGLGVGQAAQNAMNTAWRVPRNDRPNPLKSRGRSLLLLGTVGLGVLVTTGLSAIGVGAGPFGALTRAAVIAVSVVINAGLFVLAFRLATTRPLRVAEVAPGAIAAALVWQVLQSFGAAYVGHTVRHASATNGVFAVVLGLLAFLYLSAVAMVVCVEVNVVRVDRLYPRALLTPFTDRVELTEADERAYRDQAQAERQKGFQEVEVSFGTPPD